MFKKIIYILFMVVIVGGSLPAFAADEPVGSGGAFSPTKSSNGVLGGMNGPGGGVSSGSLGVQADEFTGAATFTIPIPVPPGRGGIQPNLALTYNSYRRNTNSWVGYGWELDLGQIIRLPEDNGRIDYYNGTRFEARFGGQSETLVKWKENVGLSEFGLAQNSFFPAGVQVDEYVAEIEGAYNIYLHLRKPGGLSKDYGWIVIDKSGRRYYFGNAIPGNTPPAVDELSGYDNPDQQWIARWMLIQVTDPNGNVLNIDYSNLDLNQGKYLDQHISKITYNDISIEFYKTDVNVNYFPIFREYFFHWAKVTRLTEIIVKTSGNRLQRMVFDYTASATSGVPLLTQINRYGKTDDKTLPPIKVQYSMGENSTWQSAAYETPAALTSFGAENVKEYQFGYLNNNSILMDINGDGFADHVLAFPKTKTITVKLGSANGFSKDTPFFSPFICADNFCEGRVTGYYPGKSIALMPFLQQKLILADMNGDSLPDMVHWGYHSDKQMMQFMIAINTGYGWKDSKVVIWNDPKPAGTIEGDVSQTTDLIDMNGDGLSDWVVGLPAKNGFDVYFNTGAGFEPKAVFWEDPISITAGHPAIGKVSDYDDGKLYVTIRDVNGDGLPDRIFRMLLSNTNTGKEEFGFHMSANRSGIDWAQMVPGDPGKCPGGKKCIFYNAVSTLGMDDPISNAAMKGYISTETADLIDMNNDGYLDRVEGDGKEKLRVHYYTGLVPKSWSNHFKPQAKEFLDPVDDKQALTNMNGRGFVAREVSGNIHTFIRDMNGDGFPDRVTVTPRDVSKLYQERDFTIYPMVSDAVAFAQTEASLKNKWVNQPVNTLSAIDNGQGVKMAVEYAPSTAFTNRFLPQILQVAHKLYVSDATAPSSAAHPESQRHPKMRWETIYYRGGNYFVQFKGDATVPYMARFNGFQQVERNRIPMPGESWKPNWTVTYYQQAKGGVSVAPAIENKFEAEGYGHFSLSGRPYSSELLEMGTTRSKTQYTWTTNADGVDTVYCKLVTCNPFLDSVQTKTYESDSGVAHTEKRAYQYDEYGNILNEEWIANGISQWTTQTTYHTTVEFDKTLHIRNRPYVVKTSAGGKLYRYTTYKYDLLGNLESEKYRADPTGAKDLIVSRVFNKFGNPKQVTGGDGVTHDFTYDVGQLFPIAETVILPNGKSLVTKRSFDRLTGQVAKTTNPNGVSVGMDYDDFGRPMDETLTATNGNFHTLRKWDYSYLTVDGIYSVLKTQMWEIEPDHPDTATVPAMVAFEELSGMSSVRCTRAEKGGYRVVYARREEAGRKVYESDVSLQGDCGLAISPPLAAMTNVTASTHDLLSRMETATPAKAWNESGSPVAGLAAGYHMMNDGKRRQETTAPNGLVTQSISTDAGRLGKVSMQAEGQTPGRSYSYNPVGDLVESGFGSDVQMVTRDMLGRVTQMTDAHMGVWSYEYDKWGRLVSQTDAKGRKTIATYDGMGRVTNRSYQLPSGVVERSEDYLYDAGLPDYSVAPGDLFQVKELDGAGKVIRLSRFGYDALYHRISKMLRTVAGVGDFVQDFEYDHKGHPISTAYTGGAALHYSYNVLGALHAICEKKGCASGEVYYSIDPVTGYDAKGRLIEEKFGNAVRTLFDYYQAPGRVKTLKTVLKDKVLSERQLTYDVMGSVTGISDPLKQLGAMAIATASYDKLDRLKSLSLPGGAAAISFDYDSYGNIKSNGLNYPGKPYQYPGKPDHLGSIGADNFSHDANGNIQKEVHRELTFDARNMLTQIKMENGYVVDFDYDFTGARVSKRVTGKDSAGKDFIRSTYYLGEAMEIRISPKETVLLHISAGDKRIATRTLGSLSDVLKPAAGVLWGVPLNQLPPLVGISGLLALLIVFFPKNSPLPLWERVRVRGWSPAVALVLIVVLVMPPAAFAGDTATYPFPTSDTNYLVYYHTDHLGSRHLITEGKAKGLHSGITYLKGDVIQRFEYAPYGREVFALNPNIPFDPSYTGQKYDGETGLYWYRSRYYNPTVGRFIQPDTMIPSPGNPQSYNRYSYVQNNPLKYTDPSGHWKDPATGMTGVLDDPTDVLANGLGGGDTAAATPADTPAGNGSGHASAGGRGSRGGSTGEVAGAAITSGGSAGGDYSGGVITGAVGGSDGGSGREKGGDDLVYNQQQKLVDGVMVYRKDIDFGGEDKYGHWWIEIDGNESYGWWPQEPVGYSGTLFGVPGELNGQTSFGGTSTVDPHQGRYEGAREFDVYGASSTSRQVYVDQIRSYANSYSGSWSWPIGQNCHSFQEGMLNKLGLTIRPAGEKP